MLKIKISIKFYDFLLYKYKGLLIFYKNFGLV